MGDIFDQASQIYRDHSTNGDPSSGLYQPRKVDIRALWRSVDLAIYAAQAGITIVDDLTARDAFFAEPENQGKLVYVNNNNGADDDADNGVYEYVDGSARIATGFYQGLAAVVQPLVTAAQAAAAEAGESASAVAGRVGRVAYTGPAVLFVDGNEQVFGAFGDEDFDYKPLNDLRDAVAGLQSGTSSQWSELYPAGQIVHMIYYGQSLQAGRGAEVINDTPLTYAYRYVGGVAAQDDIGSSSSATNHASLVAHVETEKTGGGRGANFYGETPAYGAAMMLNQLYAADGFTMGDDAPALLSSVPAIGAQRLAALMDGGSSDGWEYLTDDIAYGPTAAAAISLAYGGLALCWQQGQADIAIGTSLLSYKTNMKSLREAAEALMQAAEANDRPLPVLIAQIAAHPNYEVSDPVIARAQLELCQEEDYFGFAVPDYIFERQNDGLHITSTSTVWMGAYFGLAAYRWCILGQKPVPLVPTGRRAGARTIALTFPLSSGRKLEWDTTIVDEQTNYGFTAVDASDESSLTISDVSIGGAGRMVYLSFSGDLPDTVQVRYAWQSDDGEKGAGNLRDDDPLVFDPGGFALPMHSWAPIFDVEI